MYICIYYFVYMSLFLFVRCVRECLFVCLRVCASVYVKECVGWFCWMVFGSLVVTVIRVATITLWGSAGHSCVAVSARDVQWYAVFPHTYMDSYSPVIHALTGLCFVYMHLHSYVCGSNCILQHTHFSKQRCSQSHVFTDPHPRIHQYTQSHRSSDWRSSSPAALSREGTGRETQHHRKHACCWQVSTHTHACNSIFQKP